MQRYASPLANCDVASFAVENIETTAALEPGGWLLVEEPDDTAAGPVNASHPDAARFYEDNRAMLEELTAKE
jgi:hypothetical protein